MTGNELLLIISTFLAAGCGAAIQWCYREYLEWRLDQGKPALTPFRKRWTIIALCVLVPSVLYLVYVFGSQTPFSLLQQVAYVGTAFQVSQMVHSRKLRAAEGGDQGAQGEEG